MDVVLPPSPNVGAMHWTEVLNISPLEFASLIFREIQTYQMDRERAFKHISPEYWYSTNAKQGACIAQQIYAERMGWT